MPLLGTRGAASAKAFGFTSGSAPPPWINFQTGDSYLGGKIVRYSTTMAVRWFPASRATTGLQSTPTPLSTTQTIPAGITSVSIYGVGGGGGGTGSNTCGGGGGGAFEVNGVAVSEGQSFSVTAGIGGLGGVAQGVGVLIQYLGNYPTDCGGQNGSASTFALSGGISLFAGAGTSGNTNVQNPTSQSDCGQGGSGAVVANPVGYAVALGVGGKGGSRTVIPTAGTNGGAGAGGANDTGPSGATDFDRGSAGSGRFGGGGGAGNAPGNANLRTGGAGGTEAGAGGRGGSTDSGGTFGLNGAYVGSASVANAGGRAYIASDGGVIGTGNFTRGSSGGGGFPGGGGGSSYYGGSWSTDIGIGSDGASGMVQMEWALP
jgi:hypothetical protein